MHSRALPHIHPEPMEQETVIWSEPGPDHHPAQAGLIVSLTPTVLSQCHSHNISLLGGAGPTAASDFRVTIMEGFASAFRPRKAGANEVTVKPDGTRIQLEFSNVGAAVSLFVPAVVDLFASLPLPRRITSRARTGKLVLCSRDPAGAVTDSPLLTDAQLVPLTILGTSCRATYEVWESDLQVVQMAVIEVYVAYFSNTAQDLPSLGES